MQEAARNLLEPIYEQKFHAHSYGFRPYRSTHHAAERTRSLIRYGYDWIVEGDIKGFFDNVNHEVLLSLLNQEIRDKRILELIRAMLKAGIMDKSQLLESEWGTPQGGILSPLLANVYLHELNAYIARKYEDLKWTQRRKQPYGVLLVRYADDFLLLVRGTREQAEALKAEVTDFLRDTLQLELSQEKTLITHIERGVDFLGFTIQRFTRAGRKVTLTRPSLKAQKRFREKSKKLMKDGAGSRWAWILSLNEYLSGWAEYYRRVSSKRTFGKLDHTSENGPIIAVKKRSSWTNSPSTRFGTSHATARPTRTRKRAGSA